MNRITLIIGLLFFTIGCDSEPLALDASRIRQAKALPHDRQLFTQGLVVDGDSLIESSGNYNRSLVRRYKPGDNTPLAQYQLPGHYFAEGLTLWQDKLIVLTWKAGVALILNKDSLQPVGEFRYQGQGWGLTHDGQHLIMSNGSANLQWRDPDTFAVVRNLSVRYQGKPLSKLNELEYINGRIWANIWHQDRIAIIDPISGEVQLLLDFSPLRQRLPGPRADVMNGIAWDAQQQRLYVTGKYWPTLFVLGQP